MEQIIYPRTTDEWELYIGKDPNASYLAWTTQKDPDLFVLSYHAEAADLWDWIGNSYQNIPALMPPITIDHRRFYRSHPEQRSIMAYIKTDYSFLTFADDTVVNVPFHYELKIYHRNTMRDLRESFGDHICYPIAILYVIHLLCHEFSHYIRLNWFIGDLRDRSVSFKERAQKFRERTLECDTGTDETETEEMALRMFLDYLLDQIVEYAPGYNGPIEAPIVGGRYDMFMRKRHPLWDFALTMFEYAKYDAMFYKQIQRPADLSRDRLLKLYQTTLRKLRKFGMEFQKDEKPWRFVD